MNRTFTWILVALSCFCTAATPLSPADQIKISPSNEYRAKANYLFNLAKLTTWPGQFLEDQASFDVCILGSDPFGLILELLAIRGVNGRTVQIRRLETSLNSVELEGCHVLFVANDGGPSTELAPDDLAMPGRLLIGDTPGFANRGGIANLVTNGDSINFEINIKAAKRAALTLDSQVLRLGKITDDQGPETGDP